MMLLGARQFFERRGAPSIPTARDYVQTGLVAMWDGIENAGWGTHDASATTWVDLISGNNMLLNGNAAFSSNSLSVDTSSRAYSSSPITSVGTLEICMSRSDSNTDVCLFALNSAGGTQMRNFVSWYSGKLGFSESNARTDVCLSVSRPWSATTFAFVPSTGAVYANGVAQTGASETFYYSAAQNLVGVSINPSIQTQRMAGSWHSVRVYSRTLSAAEIAANYAIDKARFNLP